MKTIIHACIAVALLASPLVGCSKKDGDSAPQQKAASATLLDEPLLQKIPNSAAGFLVMDFSGDGYKKFITSPWANDLKGLSAIKSAVDDLQANGASEEQVKIAKTILDSLQKLGLVSADGKSQVDKVLAAAVLYVATQKKRSVMPKDS